MTRHLAGAALAQVEKNDFTHDNIGGRTARCTGPASGQAPPGSRLSYSAVLLIMPVAKHTGLAVSGRLRPVDPGPARPREGPGSATGTYAVAATRPSVIRRRKLDCLR